MANIINWNARGNHAYSTGVDHVALFVDGKNPRAWNGVTAINESPSGAEVTKIYADNIHYFSLLSKEEFGCTIECYSTPKEFDACNGIKPIGDSGFLYATAQPRSSFVLAYRVANGTDTVEATDGSYTYHFVFGCKAGVSSTDHATINESPEAATRSYEITTTPINETVDNTEYSVAHAEVVVAKNKIDDFEEAIFDMDKFTEDAITLADIIAAANL